MLWHRLSDVARLYRNTLGVQLPQDMKELLAAVQIRHDFVHRNGRTPDGKQITLTPEQITDLIELVQNLIDGIEAQQKNLSEKAKAIQQSPNDHDPEASDNIVDLDLPGMPKNK